MSFSTFRAEALAVCGIFAALTSLYYLTTSKAPEDTRQSAAQTMRKNWNSSFTKQTCFLSGVPCIFPIEGTFFLLSKDSLGFFGVRGLRAGSLAQIGFPERLSWVMEGAKKWGGLRGVLELLQLLENCQRGFWTRTGSGVMIGRFRRYFL